MKGAEHDLVFDDFIVDRIGIEHRDVTRDIVAHQDVLDLSDLAVRPLDRGTQNEYVARRRPLSQQLLDVKHHRVFQIPTRVA